MVHIHGFEPYFWVECPKDFVPDQKDLEIIKNNINERGESIQRVGKGRVAVKKIELHKKESLMYYKGEGD